MAQIVSLARRGWRLGFCCNRLLGLCPRLLALLVFGSGFWPLYPQTLKVQPYLSFDWDPLAYDTQSGDSSDFEYRAFNFDQTGIKFTFTMDNMSVFLESRGFPSGANTYNTYDGYSEDQVDSYEKIVYYAWAKYQFTPSGAIWVGKFKPAFGPMLIDSSHFGAGWQQKAGSHTVSAFVFQPGANLKRFIPKGSGWAYPGPADTKGIRFLLMDEYMSQTMYATFGAAYTVFTPAVNTNNVTQLHFDAFVSYSGLPKWTFTGEGAVAVYMQEDGIYKDSERADDPSDAGVGFALFASAEYKLADPIALGLSFELDDVLVGAKKNTPANGKRVGAYDYGIADGEINLAELGLYTSITPGKGFSIQPKVSVELANLFNGNDHEGSMVGCNFQLRVRWEPSITLSMGEKR
jgi:hypothetical protein